VSELISMRFECLRIAAAMKLPARETVAAARLFGEYLCEVRRGDMQGPRPVAELKCAEARDIRGKGFITREELCVSMEVDPQKLDEEARSDMQHADAREFDAEFVPMCAPDPGPEMVRHEKYTPGTVLL